MKRLMLGNEAIAMGAYQAGVQVASGYPGTPSTEILQNLAKYPGVYAEWATNEKVGFDTAIGAAYSGRRAMATTKHVGLNVASDSFFYAVYTGMQAGLIFINADDPGMHSSQNEQDNRHFAKFAKVAMLEPSDSQECYDFTKTAMELSEIFDTPVVLRTTTRISHSRSIVDFTDDGKGNPLPPAPAEEVTSFKRDPAKYVMIPGFARRRHPVVEERLKKISEWAESWTGNRIEPGDESIGIVSSGIAYQYAREVFPNATFLKLGLVWPLPDRLIRQFAARVKKVVVIEELDPFFEEHLKAMGIECVGKEFFSILGEFSPQTVRESSSRAGLLPNVRFETAAALAEADLPQRPPALCPGCAHRPVFHVLKKLRAVVNGDIGCYTLGVMPPLSAMDTCGCMGASIAVSHGMNLLPGKEKKVAVIGDSTFYHSGVPALMNMVYNQGNGLVIVLDNSITAMTGHQDHPGTGQTLQKLETVSVDMEGLIRAIGVKDLTVVDDPYDIKSLQKLIKEKMDAPGVSVIIARYPCVLHIKEKNPTPQVDPEVCTDCGICLKIGCSPLQQAEGHVTIDQVLCNGCGLCIDVCPSKAISVEFAAKGGKA